MTSTLVQRAWLALVSLHENGIGYVAYHKSFLLAKRAEGFDLPNKTTLEWKLPVPGQTGAVHAASLILPSNYCRSDPLSEKAKSKTPIFGLDCAAEIGLFLSKEAPETLEAQLLPIGHPIFIITLENGLRVSIVARCVYRKLKSGRNDGEAHRGSGVNE